ncbi:MAG: alginate lyase family protein [Nitrospiria bacterium]
MLRFEKIKSLFLKLRNLSADEALFRMKAKGIDLHDRYLIASGQSVLKEHRFLQYLSKSIEGEQGNIKDVLLNSKRQQDAPKFFITEKDRDKVRNFVSEKFPGWMENTYRTADKICVGEFHLLGIQSKYGRPVPWHTDPETGKTWPNVPYYRIPIFAGAEQYGDVKYVWELNRHQFLPNLGKAYWLTGDERYAAHCLELIAEWIQANPYLMGVNWASALEVAVRALSWLWAYFFCLHSKAMHPGRHFNILRALYQHGHFLERHLSFYFSPYNHLIGEASALFCLGTLFPEYACAARWKEKGWAILHETVDQQFYPDGGTVEQAASYHYFTLGFYLYALLLKKKNGERVSDRVWKRIEKALDFSLYMILPDGSAPMLGDNDDAQAYILSEIRPWDFRAFLSIGAALYDRPDFKRQSFAYSESAFWFLGAVGWEAYEQIASEAPEKTSVAMKDSGYYVMRTGWDKTSHYLCFDCGPLADGVFHDQTVSAAHGHADALSLVVAVYGKPILIDPGFYTYNGDLAWHRYFRETAAHNTVVVDNLAQAEYRGRLKWSHAPDSTLHYWAGSENFDYAEGSHNGYDRLPEKVIHRRRLVFLKPNYWLVRDELTGVGAHQVDRYFHLAPSDIVSDKRRLSVKTMSDTHANMLIQSVEENEVSLEIIDKGKDADCGWFAPAYGKKTRGPVARYRMRGALPLTSHTLLVPFEEETPEIEVWPLAIASMSGTDPSNAFIVRVGNRRDLIFFSATGKKAAFYNGWECDVHTLWAALDENDRVTSFSMIDGAFLNIEGKAYIQMDKKIEYSSLSFQDERPTIELSESVEVMTSFKDPRIVIRLNGNTRKKIDGK